MQSYKKIAPLSTSIGIHDVETRFAPMKQLSRSWQHTFVQLQGEDVEVLFTSQLIHMIHCRSNYTCSLDLRI